jgi:hypothetical protein
MCLPPITIHSISPNIGIKNTAKNQKTLSQLFLNSTLAILTIAYRYRNKIAKNARNIIIPTTSSITPPPDNFLSARINLKLYK